MDSNFDKKRERGKKFSEWFRRVTKNPLTLEDAKASDIARAIGMSNTRVGEMLNNDCLDSDGLLSLPRANTIDKIAQKYKASADEAKIIVGIMPEKTAENVIIPAPGSTVFTLATNDILIAPPGTENPAMRAALVEAYLLGQRNQTISSTVVPGDESSEE